MTPSKTTVDWLRFRTRCEPVEVLEALKPLFGDVASLVTYWPLERAMLGFQQALQLVIADMPIGRIDFGGEAMREWVRVDITGKGCEWVRNWDVSSLEQLPDSQIRRLDAALTTWEGEIGHDQVVEAHAQGRFICNGRPPALRQIISSDPEAGRTCYVGNRKRSDKFGRFYEKGWEMAAARGRQHGTLVAVNGHDLAGIYRCEVEFKAETTDIPWSAVADRDSLFAGAYPFCSDVLPGVEPDTMERKPARASQDELAVALENCRIQFGPTLFTALQAYHGDMTAVWDKVIGREHNRALLQAGVLLVEHE